MDQKICGRRFDHRPGSRRIMSLRITRDGRVGLDAGDGLGASQDLLKEFLSPILNLPSDLEDGYRFPCASQELVMTSDVFSVDPIVFPGGDIGRIAATGVINDLLASGAHVRQVSLGIYASEKLERSVLADCLGSFVHEVTTNGGAVVCGDTKVHADRNPELLLFATGIGVPWSRHRYDLTATCAGDDIFVTGPLGNHSLAVMSARNGLGFESVIASDARSLTQPIENIAQRHLIHSLRDLTRGGLVAGLWDGFKATALRWTVYEDDLPVERPARAAAEMLGLDPLALTNEGCMMITAPSKNRDEILRTLSTYDSTAGVRLIGAVGGPPTNGPLICSSSGVARFLPLPAGIGVPRLC
ncbi:MAG: AIR synthase-related protein [Desulfobulbaceae bacterium]